MRPPAGPHGSPSDAKHRPETAPTRLLTMRFEMAGLVTGPPQSTSASLPNGGAPWHRASREWGNIMLRRATLACGLVLAAINAAAAETTLERGSYLVNTIMACGNC